jgi:hypothetical protein
MIKFKTPGGQWSIDTPTIDKYYQIQELIILSDQPNTQVELISILSGAPIQEVRAIAESEFIQIWNKAALGPLSSLTQTKFENRITVDGKEYAFLNIAKLTIGELADMDTLKHNPQIDRQLHKMMAILYRPVIGDEIEPHSADGFAERAELFLTKMPISNVVAAIDFFFHITKVSLSNTMDSLVPLMMEMMQDLTETQMNELTLKLQEDGVDLSSFLPETTSLRPMTAQDLES